MWIRIQIRIRIQYGSKLGQNPGSGSKLGQNPGCGSKFNVFGSRTPFFVLFLLFSCQGQGGSSLRPRFFTFMYNIGRMPGFEPKMLRPQPSVLPMSYTYSAGKHFLFCPRFTYHTVNNIIFLSLLGSAWVHLPHFCCCGSANQGSV